VSTTSSTLQSLSSIDGLASGLNTTQIISQLMQLAARPQTALKNVAAQDKLMVAALQGVSTTVGAFQTAAEALRNAAGWNVTTAASSDSGVTASAAAGAAAGTLSFDVRQLATAQTSISTQTYSGLTGSAATGPLVVTRPDGSTVAVQTGDGTLAAVVAAVNASGAGVRAAAVQVGPSAYRLQLQSSSTGAGNGFTVTGLSGALDTLATAQDATLALGGSNSYLVTSPSNTVTGLLPGVTVTLTRPATGVTVAVQADPGGLADKVEAMVKAVDTALSGIAKATAFDPSSDVANTLTGNTTVRNIASQILSAVSSGVGGRSLAGAGLSVTRDGQVTFDRSAFLTAYAADPAGTQAAFAGSGTVTGAAVTTGSVAFRSASDTTHDGSYAVVVTRAATHSAASLDSSTVSAGQVVKLGWGSKQATYTVTGSETPAQLAAAITAASQQAGVGVTATASGSTLQLTAGGWGGLSAFSLAVDGQAKTVTAGDDVAGTINGTAAVGSGQVLGSPVTDPTLGGLALTVSLTPADLAGGPQSSSVTYTAGIAQRLATLGTQATDPVSGTLSNVIDGQQSSVDDLTARIKDWDSRLAIQQASLQKQYAALEVTLGKLKDQSSWLTGQISGLYQYNSSGKG
jgi:flagellar hook-associated protein 2